MHVPSALILIADIARTLQTYCCRSFTTSFFNLSTRCRICYDIELHLMMISPKTPFVLVYGYYYGNLKDFQMNN